MFYSFPSLLVTSSLIMHFLQKIQKRYTSVAFVSVYHRLRDHKTNQLYKDFCQVKINQTNCLHILAQQTNKVRLRDSFWADTQFSCLGIMSLNILPFILLSKAFLQTVQLPLKAWVHYFSLFLKDKCISSLVWTKYIEKKFTLVVFASHCFTNIYSLLGYHTLPTSLKLLF